MRKKILTAAASLTLVGTLTACGSSGAGVGAGDYKPLEDIKVKVTSAGSAPQVEMKDAPTMTGPGAQIKVQGKGETVKDDQMVGLKIVPFENQQINPSTYQQTPVQFIGVSQLKDGVKQEPELKPLTELVTKSKPGADLVWGYVQKGPAAQQDASGSPAPQTQQTAVGLVQITKAISKSVDSDKSKLPQSELLPDVDTKDPKNLKFTKGSKSGNLDNLTIQVLKPGDGPEIKPGDTAEVSYDGWTLSDGKEFDSSIKHGGQPISVTVGGRQVIPGWDWGLEGMKQGEEAILTIPVDLAYGDQAAQQGKPAGDLSFYIKIDKVTPGKAPAQ